MHNFKKRIIGFVLSLTILSSIFMPISTYAAENDGNMTAVDHGSYMEVNFENLDENPKQSYNGVNNDGEEYTVTIEKVSSSSNLSASIANSTVFNSLTITSNFSSYDSTTLSSSTTKWKVSYVSGFINCYFYMNVKNNKVTSVFDKKIIIIGGTYSDATLKKSTKYGKLSFDYTSYGDLIAFSCWLKGTVTGSSNDISVSFDM